MEMSEKKSTKFYENRSKKLHVLYEYLHSNNAAIRSIRETIKGNDGDGASIPLPRIKYKGERTGGKMTDEEVRDILRADVAYLELSNLKLLEQIASIRNKDLRDAPVSVLCDKDGTDEVNLWTGQTDRRVRNAKFIRGYQSVDQSPDPIA